MRVGHSSGPISAAQAPRIGSGRGRSGIWSKVVRTDRFRSDRARGGRYPRVAEAHSPGVEGLWCLGVTIVVVAVAFLLRDWWMARHAPVEALVTEEPPRPAMMMDKFEERREIARPAAPSTPDRPRGVLVDLTALKKLRARADILLAQAPTDKFTVASGFLAKFQRWKAEVVEALGGGVDLTNDFLGEPPRSGLEVMSMANKESHELRYRVKMLDAIITSLDRRGGR